MDKVHGSSQTGNDHGKPMAPNLALTVWFVASGIGWGFIAILIAFAF